MATSDPGLPRALLARPGCYTTARVGDGRVRHAASHERRLRRDARALGLAEPESDAILEAFEVLAQAEFGRAEGIVRLALCRHDSGATALIGTPRPVGPEPASWTAVSARFPHPGPTEPIGVKRCPVDALERARQLTRDERADETILFDVAGRLVEGARSNLLWVDASGALLWPDPGLGAVAGVALELVCAQHPEATAAEVRREEITRASELIAVSAVRGARPIVTLDGRPIGDARPGRWAMRLRELLD